MKALSGLDMAPTLQWYTEHQQMLSELIPCTVPLGERLPFPLRGVRHLQLTRKDLTALWFLFPEEARGERCVLRLIEGWPATWFDRVSLVDGPLPTTKLKQALSPTAIIPSYADYSYWQRTRIPTCDIRLYHIRPSSGAPAVQRIVHAEGFVHEVAHSIIAPALYEPHMLDLPNGQRVKSDDWFKEDVTATVEKHLPISHYAEVYRNRNNTLKRDDQGSTATAVSEEMAECVAAFLLGFVFCKDIKRRLNPFSDRPEVQQMVHNFLHAKSIRFAALSTGL